MTDSSTQKLQAWIAHQGVASRRKAEAAIAAGEVTVDGVVAHLGQRIDPTTAKVLYQGKSISPQKKTHYLYYLVNKPVGVVSTTNDELGRENVVSLVPELTERLYPVGRLDKDSEGLMLLTNDGTLAYFLTHPKYEVLKTYHVLVKGTPTAKALHALKIGVMIDGVFTSPAIVEVLKKKEYETWLSITIHEGKQHQVRRMMRRVGYDVLQLIRVQLGPFKIEDLFGQPYRRIKAAELKRQLQASYPDFLEKTMSDDGDESTATLP